MRFVPGVLGSSDGSPARRINARTAPTEVEAVLLLSQHSVRPKGLEPLTFWLVVARLIERARNRKDAARIDAEFWSIVECQESPDAEIASASGAE